MSQRIHSTTWRPQLGLEKNEESVVIPLQAFGMTTLSSSLNQYLGSNAFAHNRRHFAVGTTFMNRHRKIPLPILIACCILWGGIFRSDAQQKPFDPPLNRLQFIGTHNSYHIAPSSALRRLIEAAVPGQGEVLNYTHRPLREQLEAGVRQIELDLYGDPKGGLYADPLGPRLAGETATLLDSALNAPGFKILHSPDFDVKTTVPTLHIALDELRAWSLLHPDHEPVMVLLELKTDSFSPRIQPAPFDTPALEALEAEIRAALPVTQLLTPDDVSGVSPTLREAVLARGWPHLSQTRGKFIFCLDNEDASRDRYLALSPNNDLRGRACFVSVAPTHPAAAWMKRNEPQTQFADIQALVKQGFMVRTRADADLKEPLAHDLTRFEMAASSGAQWISTDAPACEPDPRWPAYFVGWPNRAVFRFNPLFENQVETK